MTNRKQLIVIKLVVIAVFASSMMGNTTIAHADERESLEQLKATTTNLIDLLVQEGVLNKDKADAIVKKATQDAARQVKEAKAKEAADAKNPEAGIAQDEKSVRVQYVPEHVKKKLRDEIRADVLAQAKEEKWAAPNVIPAWTDRIAFNGDIRLRYQNDNFSDNNAPIAVLNDSKRFANTLNSSEERRRLRTRATFGVDAKVNDTFAGGLRFITGLLATPVTPNQTEGIAQGKFIFGLDRAFLKASPTSWMTLQGGRFANPFMYTDVLWDPDLAFDGFAASFTPKLNDRWSSFTTVGAFPIEEIQSSEVNKAKDKWIYALQTGVKWQAANKTNARLAMAYYDYKNVEGKSNPNGQDIFNSTVPVWRQKGNNTFDINKENNGLVTPGNVTATGQPNVYGLASKFRQINLTGQLDLMTFDPVHVTLTGDYIKNIGFDKNEIFKRSGRTLNEETDAYNIRLDVGHNTFTGPASNNEVKRGDWHVAMGYKRIEADSMLDGFTDSNFNLGGTDAKGWVLSGDYGIDKNTWISGRYLNTETISGLAFSVDVFLLDLTAKF